MINSVILGFLLLLYRTTNGNDQVRNVIKRQSLNYESCEDMQLDILVSPLVSSKGTRRLEVQWENAPYKKGDWIGLFSSDPRDPSNNETFLEKISVEASTDWKYFSTYEKHINPEQLGFKGRCLDYYAAYFDSQNNTQKVTCLRIEPTWMADLKPEIGRKRIRNAFIPGTHDSGAYGEHKTYLVSIIISKYSITQDETVLGQLIHGARFLDLRVGYYSGSSDTFWVNHGILQIHPLKTVLQDVKTFMENTNEIVILDFHEFPVGFTNNDIHYKLADLLNEELSQLAVSFVYNWDSTFDEIWASGKRLIIGYNNKMIVPHYSFLWPSVGHKWGNVQNLNNLYKYLSDTIKSRPHNVWSAMAQLTPRRLDVLLDTLKGLRTMAEAVNHNVTSWFSRKEWKSKSNIVAVDFIRNTGIVRAAIEWYKTKGECANSSKINY